MRGMRITFTVVGLLMLVGGVAGLAYSWSAEGGLTFSGLAVMCLTMVVTGGIFVLVGRWLRGLDTSDVLARGIPGTALITSVQDTGTTINTTGAVIRCGVTVTVPGRPAYPAELRVILGRTQWGILQPGMQVGVKVDPAKPERVALDPSVPVGSPNASTYGGAFDGAAWTLPPGVQLTGGGSPGLPYMKAADVIARGVPATGTLLLATPTGMTAAQFGVPDLEPYEADDPVFLVQYAYPGPDGMARQEQRMVRVPDGKAYGLVQGRQVPVAYLPDVPGLSTIDWSRL